MPSRTLLGILLIVTVNLHTTLCFKTREQLKQRYKELENDPMNTKDAIVGKAMDFIYSNRTVMSLLARELWNVGSLALDRIVEAKGTPVPRKSYA